MEYSTIILWISLLSSSLCFLGFISKKLSRLPPGPIPLPLIGNLFLLNGEPDKCLAKLARIYGPIMTLQLGRVTTVVISSADLAREALYKNDRALSGRFVIDGARALGHHESSVLWRQPDNKWRRLRGVYNKYVLSPQCLDGSQEIRKMKVNELVACLSESSRAGRAINVRQLIHATLNNFISNVEFSTDMARLKSQASADFQELSRSITAESTKPNLADWFPVLRPFDPQGIRRRVADSMKKLHRCFDLIIEKRLHERAASGYPRKNDLLEAFLDLQEDGKEDAPTTFEMKDAFVELFIAATDTTSTTLEWAMAELLRNPDAMAKARAELKEVIEPGRQVQESDIAHLPYLRSVVKETFRLHPPGPLLLPRQTLADVEISGFKIPKGTQVLVNLWAMGRDEALWTEPNSFKPDRFLDSKVDFRGRDFELIPFGVGRRICPGMPLADRIVHFILASLIHLFAWKLPDEMEPQDLDMRDHFVIVSEKVVLFKDEELCFRFTTKISSYRMYYYLVSWAT